MDASITQVASLWEELQRAKRYPQSEFVTACEEELKELMRQLDIMMQMKYEEWKQEVETLHTQLDTKEHHCSMQKAISEQKNHEVSQLRQQVENMEKSQQSLIKQYEAEICAAKTQVQKIKRDYERIQKRHNKMRSVQPGSTQADSARGESEKLQNRADADVMAKALEVRNLNERLEACQQENKNLDYQCQCYQQKIRGLEMQIKLLTEKCDALQKSQSDRRVPILDSSEFALRAKVTQLEGQLDRARDTIATQERQFDKLQGAVDEKAMTQVQCLSQDDELQQHLQAVQERLQEVESEKIQLDTALQSREQRVHIAEQDVARYHTDIYRLEQILEDKEEIISRLTDTNNRQESDQVIILQRLVDDLKQELQFFKSTDSGHKQELSELKADFERLQRDNDEASRQLRAKETNFIHAQNEDIMRYQVEMAKLNERLRTTNQMHDSDFESMKIKLDSITDELHLRNVTVATLSQRVSAAECQLRETTEMLEQKRHELEVTKNETESLKLENELLRTDLPLPVLAPEGLGDSENDHRSSKYRNQGDNTFGDSSLVSEYLPKRQLERSETDQFSHIEQPAVAFLSEPHPIQQFLLKDKMPSVNTSLNLELAGLNLQASPNTSQFSQDQFSDRCSSRGSISEKFLLDENRRMKELERRVDGHIHNLHIETDAIIQKYST